MKTDDYLLTGASGFLGKVILSTLPGTVISLGRTSGNTYQIDLSNEEPLFKQTFDTVIHATGKAHVIPITKEEIDDFFRINVEGTIKLTAGLEALQKPPKYFVFISTVAVYGEDVGEMIDEEAPLNGSTPYAKSKIEAERFLQGWCSKHSVILTILRLPLIVAPNPPGNLGNMLRIMKKGLYVGIGSGRARKSMVLAEDVARFIPIVKEIGGIYNLTDGDHPAMIDLETAIASKIGKRKPMRFPNTLLKGGAILGDFLGKKAPLNSLKYSKLIATLTFSDAKARKIGWNPRSVIANLPF